MKLTKPKREIIELITNEVISNNVNDMYEFFIANYETKYSSRGEGFQYSPKETLRIKNLKNSDAGLIGIDLPIILTKSKGTKTLMILGQDPLRNQKDFPDNKKIVVGTPFAFHSNYYGEKGWGKLYLDLVKELCDIYDTVYVTDKYKIWIEKGDAKTIINETSLQILKKEIEIVNPDKILALGSSATSALKKIKVSNDKIITSPHPQARAKLWIKFGAIDGTHENIKNRIVKLFK